MILCPKLKAGAAKETWTASFLVSSWNALSLLSLPLFSTDPAVPVPAVFPKQGGAVSRSGVRVRGACPRPSGETISMSVYGHF